MLGGAIVKVPQILKIVSSKSARGLSLPAFVCQDEIFASAWLMSRSVQALDALACGFALAYAARNHFPFSTYGENFFLTIQNVIITLLIVWYAAGQSAAKPLSGIGGNMRASGNVRGVVIGLLVTAAISVWLAAPSLSSLKTREHRANGSVLSFLLLTLSRSLIPSSVDRADRRVCQSAAGSGQSTRAVHRQPVGIRSVQRARRLPRAPIHH